MPPAAIAMRTSAFISQKTYPSSAADTPKIPIKDVAAICATCSAFVSIRSSAGLKQNTYGTMKTAIARREALKAVFIGLDFAIAEPA